MPDQLMEISDAEALGSPNLSPTKVTQRKPARSLASVNWSFVFLALCGVLFFAAVSLRLNGSSSAFWVQALQATDEPTGVIAGIPRLTRSDEWMFWTPALLSQLRHIPPMPVENPSLGAGAAPLLQSLPARHYSMFFRPQLWGFFFFDIETGFAWFWSAKVFGLLIAFFLLFRLLMPGRDEFAILGSIAVSYSSYIQWFFSCPPMLPEMLACWAIMLVTGKKLFDPIAVWGKLCAAAIFGACAVNFILCCYPPFQIPLAYLALTFFGVFVWERRGQSMRSGFVWLIGAIALVALVLWPMFIELRPTLEIVRQTSYPGARRSAGGTMPIAQLLSGLLNFFDGRRPHPEMFPNTTESSNFLPLWLPVIAGLGWRWARWKWVPKKSAMMHSETLCFALAGFILFFVCYALVGLPESFCRWTGLNFITERRTLLVIGIAGLLLAFLTLRADGRALVAGKIRFCLPAVIALATLGYLLSIRSLNPRLLDAADCAVLISVAATLGSLYFCARPIIFASCLAGALLFNNALVNPIAEGLPLLLRSKAAQHVAAIHRADPTAAWIGYQGGITPQLILASGARVLNGIKAVPDLPFLATLDHSGRNRSTYNRYSLMILEVPKNEQEEGRFDLKGGDFYDLYLSPLDPAFSAAGVRYVMSSSPLPPAVAGRMRLVDALPENSLWIYQLPPLFGPGNRP